LLTGTASTSGAQQADFLTINPPHGPNSCQAVDSGPPASPDKSFGNSQKAQGIATLQGLNFASDIDTSFGSIRLAGLVFCLNSFLLLNKH
jgi:hypothetical protein